MESEELSFYHSLRGKIVQWARSPRGEKVNGWNTF